MRPRTRRRRKGAGGPTGEVEEEAGCLARRRGQWGPLGGKGPKSGEGGMFLTTDRGNVAAQMRAFEQNAESEVDRMNVLGLDE